MRYSEPFPRIGELVVAQVESIQRNTVQVKLEDFTGLPHEENAHGMVHISELSNRWVKNINNLVSIGQRVILTVLRVNESRGYVDLSLRRVSSTQRKLKMNEWKHNKKIQGLLKFYAEQHGMDIDELYDKALYNIIDTYGDFRSGFELIKEEGRKEMDKIADQLDLTEEQIDDLYELIQKNVKIPKIEITGEFEIISYEGNGIKIIQDALLSLDELEKPKGVEVDLQYIGAPIYRVEIKAKEYPEAERFLSDMEEKIQETITGNSYFELHRENLSNEA